MAERLKDMFFTSESMNDFAETIQHFYHGFDKKRFIGLVFDDTFAARELKQKMRHTTECLKTILPESFPETLEILKNAATKVKGFEAMSIPEYVELYGGDNWELSLPAFGMITRNITCELAIRPFMDERPGEVIPFLLEWAGAKNANVRRLASEGSRPRLPWAMALPKFKRDPTPILPVLEKLKNDPSETVRRSVSNNLNDISKDNPAVTLATCKRWYGETENTDRLVKHACRTLLKAGDPQALRIFSYGDPADIEVQAFELSEERVKIGSQLHFSFRVTWTQQIKVRLEYAIQYAKARGRTSAKVFKIAEGDYKPGTYTYRRKHSFADMSTRKHYPGTHRLTLIVNGVEKGQKTFEVEKN